jgi:hypothetical protein
VGIRRRGRGVPTYDPNNTFYYGGLLLCFTFGMVLAGIRESILAGDWAWFWFFVAGEVITVVLYFWNVWCWLKFPGPKDEYEDVESTVEWWDGYDHQHPGDPRGS